MANRGSSLSANQPMSSCSSGAMLRGSLPSASRRTHASTGLDPCRPSEIALHRSPSLRALRRTRDGQRTRRTRRVRRVPRAGPTGPDNSSGSGGGEPVAPSRPERVPRRQCAWAASLRPWDESTTSRLYLVCRQAVDQAGASQRRLIAGLHAAGALVIRDAALARRKGRPVGSLTIPLTLPRFEHVY